MNENGKSNVPSPHGPLHELTADEVELVSGGQKPAWGDSFVYCPAGDGGSKFDRYD